MKYRFWVIAVFIIMLLSTGCGKNNKVEISLLGEVSEKLTEGTRVIFDYDAEDKSQTLYFGSCGDGRLFWQEGGHDSDNCFRVSSRKDERDGVFLPLEDKDVISKWLYISFWAYHEANEDISIGCTLQIQRPDSQVTEWPESVWTSLVPAGRWVYVEGKIPVYADATLPRLNFEAEGTEDFMLDHIRVTVDDDSVTKVEYQNVDPDVESFSCIFLDFEDGEPFFESRGEGRGVITNQAHNGSKALAVKGRTLSWHGIERDFTEAELQGKYLHVSFWTKHNNNEPQDIRFCIQEEDADGKITYNWIAAGFGIGKGEWTKVAGEYLVGADTRKVILYFEATDPELTFLIDDVELKADYQSAEATDQEKNLSETEPVWRKNLGQIYIESIGKTPWKWITLVLFTGIITGAGIYIQKRKKRREQRLKTKIFRTCVTKILALLLAVCLAAGFTPFTPFTVGASEKTGQVGICFEDVKESDWYYEAVNYVSSRGIMTGMSEKIFGPVLELKRAHFATLIYRMEGSPDVAYKEKFADVPQGEFYSDAVIWANENGIINGYDDTGLFEPGRNISREELAVMLYRYANCRGLDTSNNEDLSAFPDKGKVNIYAKDAIAWAVEKGVITGDKGKLNPQGKANRAECAAMIQRFFGLLEKNITMPEEGERNFLEQYEKDGTLYGMKNLYSENFSIGVALEPRTLNGEKERALVKEQFSSITCENAMKPAALLNHEKTLQRGEEEYPVIDASGSEPLLTFAKENGMKVRAHTLVWYQQTPRWLFTEGFSDSADAPLVSREIMLKRMENYICQVTTYFNQNYPGLITGWDVVNEAIDSNSQEENHMFSEGNYWYEIIGADYVEKAFTYARKYADPAQNLFYNDFNCYEKEESICKMIEGLQEKGLIDGIGMQSHVLLGYPSIQNYENAIRIFADMGLEIQITELDVRQSDNSIEGQRELAVRYKEIFRTLKRLDDEGIANITNVTLWGLDDSRTWLNNDGNIHHPLLFDENLNPKPAFFGAILDDSI